MRKYFCLAVILAILMGIGIAKADDLKEYQNILITQGTFKFEIPKIFEGSFLSQDGKTQFKFIWDSEKKILEIIGDKIHLRIYTCGKVEKLEWKEINKNEENQSGILYINPRFYGSTLELRSR